MDESLAITINSRVRDVIRLYGLEDDGDFPKLFSRDVADRLANSQTTAKAVEDAFQRTGANFSMLNRGRIRVFKEEVTRLLEKAVRECDPIVTLLRQFKQYAERSLVNGFRAGNRNEEFCRSNLQSYLERAGITSREVVSGGGLIDIVVEGNTVIEVKLWKGGEYYEAGIEELREYMRTEQRRVGYYVVFDTVPDNAALPDEVQLAVPEGRVLQIAVRMVPGPPSKRRAARREALELEQPRRLTPL